MVEPMPASPFSELADLPLWVSWRYEERGGKPTKVPVNPATGYGAKSNDPATWGCRAAAEKRAQTHGLAGIGINLADHLGGGLALVGIDLDTCRAKADGNIADWAREVIDGIGSYTEISPSGTGFKIFARMGIGDRDVIRKEIRALRGDPEADGIKWTGGGGDHPPAIELFTGRRYFTVTEQRLDGAPNELRVVNAAAVQWLIRAAGPALASQHAVPEDATPPANDDSRSGVAFRRGLAMRRAGRSYEEMCAALRNDPETADWVREKGEANGERKLKRIWDKADRIVIAPPYKIDPKAPLATARLFRKLRFDVDDEPTLFHHRGGFYAWNGAAYPEADGSEVRAAVYCFLNECVASVKDKETGEWKIVSVKPNTALVNNVLDALRADALLPLMVEAPAWLDRRQEPEPGDVIACANGLLHLPTTALLAHTPVYFTHNALQFAFDPGAPSPTEWSAFLGQLWGDDVESIATLQEIFGYALGADTSQQKAFLLVGPKRSGKGTIARVLTEMVGKENTVSPTLASLGTNFGLQPLIGKRVGIVSDARLSGRTDQAVVAERLLSITGEDGITIDRKYRDAWTGRLATRFLVLTNELPRLNDASGALASRFIVLVLTESFFGREDPGLTNRLLAELPGILNWAIEGWRRLRDRGHFVQPASAMEVVGELEDLGSPIGAFLRDRCDVGPGRSVEVTQLFLLWEEWCMEQRRQHSGDRQSFGRNLRAAFPGIVIKQRRTQHGMERYYEGIGLKGDQGVLMLSDEEAKRW